jgi:hypothetical protein
MRRFPAFAIALLALLPFTFDGAVEAAEPGAWWAAADFWLAGPSNLNLDVAVKENPALATGGSIVGLDFGSTLSPRLQGGWRPDDATKNAYGGSIWYWGSDESLRQGGGVMPVVSDPLFGNISSESVESDADVKAFILNLMLSRRLAATRKSSWHWGVGLRYSSYEIDWAIDYFDPTFFPSGPIEEVEIGVTSSGIGLTAGIDGAYNWSSRWRTNVRAQIALLTGETEASYTDRGYIDDPILGIQGFFTTGLERSGDDRVFHQVEIEARITYQIMEGLDVSLGYALLNWADAQQADRLLDDVQGGLSFTRDDVAFDGFVISVSYVHQ